MMEEEEETLFDQENLLGRSDESRERLEKKRKLVKTGALSMAFFCLGLCIAIPGPTLLDLGRMVGRDTQHMVLIFTARSLGYLLGSVAGGLLGDVWDQQLLLAITLGCTAWATAGIPWCTALMSMAGLVAVQGLAIGVLDSGGNVFCIRIWGKQSPSYMQLLHFAFGVGAFLAPLIARPFLGDATSIIGANQSIGLPYTFEIQAFKSLPGTGPEAGGGPGEKTGEDGGKSLLDIAHLHEGSFFHGSEDKPAFYRQKRDTPGSSAETQNNASGIVSLPSPTNATTLVNETVVNASSTYTIAPTTTQTPPQPVAKKPGFINSDRLDPKHADGQQNKAKLVDIIKNPNKVQPVQPAGGAEASSTIPVAVTTMTPSASDVGQLTGGNETMQSTNTSDTEPGITAGSRSSDQGEKVVATKTLAPTTATSTTTTTASTTTIPTTTQPSTTTTLTTTTESTTTTTTPTTTTTVPQSTLRPSTVDTTTTSSATPPDAPSKSQPTDADVPQPPTKPISSSDTHSLSNSTNGTLHGDGFQIFFETVRNMSKIQFAYLLIGLLLVVNTGLFSSLYYKDRMAHRSGPLTVVLSHEELTRPPHSKCFIFAFLGMLFMFFFTYVGMEVTFGGLLPTFALGFPDIINTQAQGATLVSLFWFSLAVGRGLAIFVARWFKPPCMMAANVTLTLVGAIILCAGIQALPQLLWAGTVTLGLGMSSLFPTAMSWAHFYYPLSGRAAAVFVVGCGLGEMSVPAATGQFFYGSGGSSNHMSLMYVMAGCAALLVVLFVSLQVLACTNQSSRSGKPGSRASPSRSGFMPLESSEDMADALDMDLLGGDDDEILATRITPAREVEDLDLRGGTARKRGVERRSERRSNGNKTMSAAANGDRYEDTEFTKLVELSD